MQIQQALAAACSALGLARLDAQLLLLHALGRPQNDRAWLLAHDTDALDPETEMRYIGLTRRRAAGTPLAYLTGVREFHGLTLQVDRRVLDPRPDTETLVDWALELLPPAGSVIDLGTGSGAIALAIRHARPDAQVSAVDASVEALAVAQANAQRLGLDVAFRPGDWLTGDAGRYDMVVANPPYIAEGDPHLEQLGHEPQMALTSGPDGLDAIRTIVAQAAAHLQPGGWLLLEHGWDQAAAVRELMAQAGLAEVQSRRDLAGIERCSGGRHIANQAMPVRS
jgi:release factor glutamine methyltransferase